MSKIDFKKELSHLYAPSKKEFTLIEVPAMQFLMVDGQGDPNTAQAYQEALETLYAVAYKIKFTSKNNLDQDYAVPPLEGLWWADDMDTFTNSLDKSQWQWTMMIMQPDWITTSLFAEACATVKKQKELAALPNLHLKTYAEGLSVQILHLGSYADEAPTLHKLHHEFMPQGNFDDLDQARASLPRRSGSLRSIE